jgi:Mg-chelatase subunit ChlD
MVNITEGPTTHQWIHPVTETTMKQIKEDVLKAIGAITHSLGDATRTYLALEHTHSVIYKAGNGERPDVLDVIIVLTDGETNPGSYDRHWAASGKRQTQIEAAKLKDRPAYVFAIGVGSSLILFFLK